MNFSKIKLRMAAYNTDMVVGLGLFFKAHDFIIKHKLGKYLLISGLIFLLIFSIGIEAVIYGIEWMEPAVSDWMINQVKAYLSLDVDAVKLAIRGGFWLLKASVKANKDAIFTAVFMIVGTPFFSIISGKIKEIITRQSTPFSLKIWGNEIVRGLSLSLKNSFKQLGLILLITLLSLIPIVGIVAPLLTFIVQAYYNGILMTDYSLEINGYNVKESQQFYAENKPIMFSIGLGFMFLLLLPVVGWFIAPTYALTASALYFLNQRRIGYEK